MPVFSRFGRRPRGSAGPFVSASPPATASTAQRGSSAGGSRGGRNARGIGNGRGVGGCSRPLVEAVSGGVRGIQAGRAVSALSYHSGTVGAGAVGAVGAVGHGAEMGRLRGELQEAETEMARLRAEAAVKDAEIGRLRDEVGAGRRMVEEQRAEAERMRRRAEKAYGERDEMGRRVRAARDDGPGSEVAAARREAQRLRHEVVELRLRVVEVERRAEGGAAAVAEVVEAAGERDERDGFEVMRRIAGGEARWGAAEEDGEEEDEEDEEKERGDWRMSEIVRLEELLGREHETRVELEGTVEDLMDTLERRDEEERRVTAHVEGRRRMAEERLQAVTRVLRERTVDENLTARAGEGGGMGLWADVAAQDGSFGKFGG